MAIVDIYNQALSKVPTQSYLSSPTENSIEAEVCNLWYNTVRKNLLRAAFWDSCTLNVRLARVASYDQNDIWMAGDPDPQWRYAYAYPSDCILPRYLTDFTKFKVGLLNPTTKVIFANTVQPILTYTTDVINPDLWDSSLEMAMIYALASEIIIPLSGKQERADRFYQKTMKVIQDANVAFANASAQNYETIPDGLAARGWSADFPPRFYFPTENYLGSQFVADRVGSLI